MKVAKSQGSSLDNFSMRPQDWEDFFGYAPEWRFAGWACAWVVLLEILRNWIGSLDSREHLVFKLAAGGLLFLLMSWLLWWLIMRAGIGRFLEFATIWFSAFLLFLLSLSPRVGSSDAFLTVAALCIGAMAWLSWRGRDRGFAREKKLAAALIFLLSVCLLSFMLLFYGILLAWSLWGGAI